MPTSRRLATDMEDSEEFRRSLEPMVIIDDDDGAVQEGNFREASPHRPQPEISIIPVAPPPLCPRRKNGARAPPLSLSYLPTVDADSSREGASSNRRSSPLEKCPICKKFFRRMRTHLLKHEMTSRPPEDRLCCPFCKKMFNTQSNMAIHMRTHTGDKPYVCDVCRKSFSQSCNLVNHLRVHTGEKPFKCPYCERAFTQSGNLNNHVRLHTSEKPFECHFCDKAFVQSGNLNSHIRNNHKGASLDSEWQIRLAKMADVGGHI